MSQVVASVTSAAGPINGNENNSSPDFQFVELPASGNLTVTVSGNPNSNSISFKLWRDISNWPDKEATDEVLTNNSTFPVSDVDMGDNYYIGNPSNAGGQTFVVTFTAG
ncbi:MAG TPA: hypothetical protein VKK31_09580 [Thermoanaerobaculia bacterium]|nr:hypothetical protein [Thermoanaerobaculia bacterium]